MEADQEYRLDDKYLTGIWYDSQAACFCEIARGAPGEYKVELINPKNGNVYHNVSVEDWVERYQQDFRQVSEEAVEDPVSVVNRAVRILSRNDIGELSGIPMQEAIDLRYARQQVEIREQSETELLSDFYDEVRESARVAMRAEGVDRETVERVLHTMDDNV